MSIPALLNIAIGYFLVGLAEEFLCRGWLLNEFLERFGNTKKGVYYSIFISALIFGLMHFTNILTGQDWFSTLIQVINAFGMGLAFGTIYYKTKNIWSVILLHAFWDFTLYLQDISIVKESTELISHFSIIALISAFIMVGGMLLAHFPSIKNIDEEPKKGKVALFAISGFAVWVVFFLLLNNLISTAGDTYKYDSIKLKEYSITYDNYEKYNIDYTKIVISKEEEEPVLETEEQLEENVPVEIDSEENVTTEIESEETNEVTELEEKYSYKLYMKDEELLFTNKKTKHTIELEQNKIIDYTILEQKDYYVLAYIDTDKNTNTFLRYSYIKKEDLSNDDEFLDNIKKNMKKYLLVDAAQIFIITDRSKDISYVATYNMDDGYYLLTSENKMSILNRDR